MVDQRSIIQLEVKKNDNLYTFCIPQGVQLHEAYDAVFEMLLTVKKSLDDYVEKEMLEQSKKLDADDKKGEAGNGVEFKTDTTSEEDN